MARAVSDGAKRFPKRFLGISGAGPAVRPKFRYGFLAFGVGLLIGNAITGRVILGLAAGVIAGVVAVNRAAE